MVAPVPKAGETEIDLNDVVKVPEYTAQTPAKDKDIIVIPTTGAPIRAEVKDGKWKTFKVWKDDDGVHSEWVDATVPAGTGFWYVNQGATKSIQKEND